MRFGKRVFGFAVAGSLLLAIGTGDAHGQGTAMMAMKPKPAAADTGAPAAMTPALVATDLGLIDVKAGDLLKPTTNDWLSYNGDHTGSRYSTLTEITPANVSRVRAKWVFHSSDAGALEGTPVVAAGVMFVTSGNDAFALDAATGNQLWHHVRSVTQGLIDDAASHHNRGVAVLGTRVFMTTDNAHLLCLDARSGNVLWDTFYATGHKNYGATSAPMVIKNLVVTGTSGGDDGARGFLAAFDSQTGKEVWRFWSIPGPGEFGNESWPNDLWEHGGGAMWMPGTFDPELNTLYWGTGNPTPDYDGSGRPGDDLYTCSVVALDPDTGKLKWHFQYSPHNLYDYDSVQTPVLINAKFKGEPRKLLMSANRNGFLYILDRTNGKFLFGEKFVSNLSWASGLDEKGRPISNGLVPNDKGVLVCPSIDGATNWYSPSYNAATNMFYFRSQEACTIFTSRSEKFEEGHTFYATGDRRPPGEIVKGFLNAFSLEKLQMTIHEPQIGTDHTWAGVMSTVTGLVAYGNQQNFIIADAHNGKPLWHFNLGQVPHASPMSYGINGRQYFAIAAGTDIFVFGL
jgi:alcohol dehydrogenase (cytochrome c)